MIEPVRERWTGLIDRRRAFVTALLSFVPLFVWWLGWFPGILSSDSFDQWGQVLTGDISNQHPAFHTWLMWLAGRVWEHPGFITLIQITAMSAVLALLADRLCRLGLGWRAAGAWVVVVATLPAVSITTIALWKDVPFTIALLWLLSELLLLAAEPDRWSEPVSGARLGVASAFVWLLRHNGFITVVLVGVALLWRMRHERRTMAWFAGSLVGFVAAVSLVLFPLAGVERTAIEPAGVFVSDVAASFVHEPGNFTDDEVEYLASIAPLDVWRSGYDCHDSTPLVFSPRFDRSVITADAARFRSLVITTYLRDLDTVLGHRWCAASYLLVPPQPGDAFFHRPPFAIADNPHVIERDPISDRAYAVTSAIYRWAEAPGRLWLTWRPALAVWAAIGAVGWLWWRRRELAGLELAVILVIAQMTNVALTTPAQEFRFAFGVYVMCLVLVAAVVARLRGSRPRHLDSGLSSSP